jgi:hypothetical protein
MSEQATPVTPEPGITDSHNASTSTDSPEAPQSTVEYSVSPGMAARLARLNVSFAFTSYQSNLLIRGLGQ